MKKSAAGKVELEEDLKKMKTEIDSLKEEKSERQVKKHSTKLEKSKTEIEEIKNYFKNLIENNTKLTKSIRNLEESWTWRKFKLSLVKFKDIGQSQTYFYGPTNEYASSLTKQTIIFKHETSMLPTFEERILKFVWNKLTVFMRYNKNSDRLRIQWVIDTVKKF